MTSITASGVQYIVVEGREHRGINDHMSDYIVAVEHRDAAQPVDVPRSISSGRYRGHITLDRNRWPFELDLTVNGNAAAISCQTLNPRVTGRGSGQAKGDSVTADINWTFPAQNCSGT